MNPLNKKWTERFCCNTPFEIIKAIRMIESLTFNTTLTILKLNCIKIYKERTKNVLVRQGKLTDSSVGFEGAKAISKVLKINSSLTELNLTSWWKRNKCEEL